MFQYPTPVVIRRVDPTTVFEAENTLEVLKVDAVLPFKVGDLGTVRASVERDGSLLVSFTSSSCAVLAATFIVTNYEMVEAPSPEEVVVQRKKRPVPKSPTLLKKKARCEEAVFDDSFSDTSDEESDDSYRPPKSKPATNMLWCNRERKYMSSDCFSANQQKNQKDKTRFSLRDATHYTLKKKVDLGGDEAVEGEVELRTFKGRNHHTGAWFEFVQEADLQTTVQYDDDVSGKQRLSAMIKRYEEISRGNK